MSVKLTTNNNWNKVVEGDFTQEGLLEMATDIQTRAAILAPRDTSALANSGVVERVLGGYRIKFGSGRVPYARIQHEGGVIRPRTKPRLSWKDKQGNWHSAKQVTIKATKYLTKAADSVARGNTAKYFRGKI